MKTESLSIDTRLMLLRTLHQQIDHYRKMHKIHIESTEVEQAQTSLMRANQLHEQFKKEWLDLSSEVLVEYEFKEKLVA